MYGSSFCWYPLTVKDDWYRIQNQFCNKGLFIESWSGSAGYPAEMLTEGAKSWRVEDESTLATLVNIEAEYPPLVDQKI